MIHNKGILSRIYSGSPTEKYHWVVGVVKGRLVVVGPFDATPKAQRFIDNRTNGIIVHLPTRDMHKATFEIGKRYKFALGESL